MVIIIPRQVEPSKGIFALSGRGSTVAQLGNSQGLIFDAALMELAHLQTGDELNVEVHEGGTLTLSAMTTHCSSVGRVPPHGAAPTGRKELAHAGISIAKETPREGTRPTP